MAVQQIEKQASINKRGCLARLRGVHHSSGPAETKVIDHILSHPEEVIRLSITNLAENSNTSEATVVRVSQLIGYQGYC